jgi:hypothetical protein
MQLVPLSTDGRVTAVGPALPVPGPLRVVLEPDGAGVRVVALGQGFPRPVGRFGAHDAAAYGPVLLRLAEQGFLGTCPAQVTADGTLVLDLAPASDCVLGNVTADLVLLAAERTVAVTREEHHQDVLAGRGGRMAVALQPATIATGKYAGQRGLEITLDGRRVGELTRLMAERYLPLVDEVAARGRRPGCEAVLRPDHRGMQVELRLPAIGATVRPGPDPTVVAPGVPTAAGPPRRPGGTAVTPSSAAAPPVRDRRARRRLVGAVGAVVGVLVLASVLGNSGRDDAGAVTASARPAAATAAPATSTSNQTATSTSADSTPTIETVDEPVVVAAAPAPRRQTPTARPTTTRPTTGLPAPTRPPTASAARSTAPAKPESAAAPEAAPKPKPAAAPKTEAAPEPPSSGCDPNYSGCVPIASDVDCAGGNGNGPEYVSGPVKVTGSDIYGLDNDHDGIGCEKN